MALAGGELGVHDGDLRKTLVEAADGLGRQGNFRDQHQGGGSLLDDLFDGANVNFGFAAGGDTVEEDSVEGSFINELVEGLQGGLLVGVEFYGLGADKAGGSTDWWRVEFGPFDNLDESGAGEGAERAATTVELSCELFKIKAFGVGIVGEEIEYGPSLAAEAMADVFGRGVG